MGTKCCGWWRRDAWEEPQHVIDQEVLARLQFGAGYFAWLLPLLLLEGAVLGWQRSFLFRLSRWKEHGSTLCDLIVSSLFIFGLSSWLGNLFTFGALGMVQQLAGVAPKFDVAGVVPHPALRWLLYFILIDFSDYWLHRAMHRWAPLWKLHSFHHAATEFNILTGNRIHFTEDALMVAGRAIVLAPLAISLPEVIGVVMVRRVIDQLQHSELAWSYGTVGRTLVMSPLHHRLHHSSHPDDYRANFGNIFVWWDRLFGSYRHPDGSRAIELGTDSAKFDREVALHPFRMMVVLQFEAMRDVGRVAGRGLRRISKTR